MENEGDVNWDVFFNEAPNEEHTHTVTDTTNPNPGGDTISDSDITALETWVQENSIAIDAPDFRQDDSLIPHNRLRESLSSLGQSIGFDNLALEIQLLKQA